MKAASASLPALRIRRVVAAVARQTSPRSYYRENYCITEFSAAIQGPRKVRLDCGNPCGHRGSFYAKASRAMVVPTGGCTQPATRPTGVTAVKESRSLVPFVLVFVAGFVAGVLVSAWKLPQFLGTPPPPGAHSAAESAGRVAGLEKMVAANPSNSQALIQLADAYHDAGNHAKAVEFYTKAVAVDPRNADAITDMGTSFRKLGKPDEAVKAYRRALEVDPNHALAMFNLGIVLRDDLKDYSGALQVWETFMERAGNTPHAVMVNRWVVQLREKLGTAPTPDTAK
jgi:cytochrome c-type biogenesis protein CcmH/NrfG